MQDFFYCYRNATHKRDPYIFYSKHNYANFFQIYFLLHYIYICIVMREMYAIKIRNISCASKLINN